MRARAISILMIACMMKLNKIWKILKTLRRNSKRIQISITLILTHRLSERELKKRLTLRDHRLRRRLAALRPIRW